VLCTLCMNRNTRSVFNLKNSCIYLPLQLYTYYIILRIKIQYFERYSNVLHWIRLTHTARCINLNLKNTEGWEREREREREWYSLRRMWVGINRMRTIDVFLRAKIIIILLLSKGKQGGEKYRCASHKLLCTTVKTFKINVLRTNILFEKSSGEIYVLIRPNNYTRNNII